MSLATAVTIGWMFISATRFAIVMTIFCQFMSLLSSLVVADLGACGGGLLVLDVSAAA